MNIDSMLLPDEEILYKGVAVPGKGSKSLLGIIIMIAVCLVPIIAISEFSQIGISMMIVMAIALLFIGIAVYAFIYNFILKNRKIKGQEYFITNQRAIIYSSKKNEFKIGYLNRFDEFRVDNEKDNFGDVYMGIVADKNNNSEENLELIRDTLLNPDKDNMNTIYFELVENPYQVMKIAMEQRKKLVPNRPILEDEYEDESEEVEVCSQKVIVKKQPIWVWILFIAMIIFFLATPFIDIINSLKAWTTYTKTSAVITEIKIKDVGEEEGQDVKYFVTVSYEINNNNYESIITNDKCYLKSTQEFNGYISNCRKYDRRFRKMKANDKVDIYVNPDKLTEVEYVPTLISSTSLILLIIGLISLFILVAEIKAKMKK